MTRSANLAAKGRKASDDEIQRGKATRALIRQRSESQVGAFESDLIAMLISRGLPTEAQRPVEGYNIDIACGPVAVEVHVCASSPLASAKLRKRIEKLLELGWSVIYVWINKYSTLRESAADEIVTFHKVAKSNPSAPRQYRVIRGSGETVLTGCDPQNRA
jgi:very-short-patch-repair endonuclease